jgi:hypothetical protein
VYRLHEQTAIVQIPNTIQSDDLLRLPRPSDRYQIRSDETRLSASPDRGDCGTYSKMAQRWFEHLHLTGAN